MLTLHVRRDGEEGIDLSRIDHLRTQCETADIASPEDYIDYLRTLVLLTKWEEPHVIRSLLIRARSQGYWDSLQLGHALTALISRLIGDPCEFTSMPTPLIETGNHLLEKQIPSPHLCAELALVTACLGLLDQNKELMSAVVQLGIWQSRLIDYHGAPFHGLWSRAEKSDPYRLTTYTYLLFSLCDGLTGDAKWRPLADSCMRLLSSSDKEPTEYDIFLSATLQNLIAREDMSIEMPEGSEPDYGLIAKVTPDLSTAATACGAGTALGAIHKKNVKIPAFGPHFVPLGESSQFGLFRPANIGNASFADVTRSDSHITGWTPLIDPTSDTVCAGKSWMHFALTLEDEATHIETMFIKEEEVSLSFVFFVRGDCIQINTTTLRPGSLERYEDKAEPIVAGGELTITPHHDGRMQIIPLAGGDHFWGATFLIAYPITSERIRYSFTVN